VSTTYISRASHLCRPWRDRIFLVLELSTLALSMLRTVCQAARRMRCLSTNQEMGSLSSPISCALRKKSLQHPERRSGRASFLCFWTLASGEGRVRAWECVTGYGGPSGTRQTRLLTCSPRPALPILTPHGQYSHRVSQLTAGA
jgi:hypothetical protein